MLRHVKGTALCAEGNELWHGTAESFLGKSGGGRLFGLRDKRDEIFAIDVKVTACYG